MNKKDKPDDWLLNRLLHYKLAKTRWAYIDVLKQRPSEALFQRCALLLQSGIEKHQLLAIDILAQMGVPEKPFWKQTLTLFFDLLTTTTNVILLQHLLHAIGRGNDQLTTKQVQILCSFAKHNNRLIKQGLVFALQGIEHPKAVSIMITLSADKTAFIRNWATFGLGTQIDTDNKAIRKALCTRTTDTHEETRLEAMVGLATRKDEGIVAVIQKELEREGYGSLLFEAIVATGNKAFLPLLQKHWKAVRQDATVSAAWKQSLKDCIHTLRSLED